MRPRLRTTIAIGTAAALALAFAPTIATTSVQDGPNGDDPHVRSASVSWVANVQYPVTDNNSQAGTTDVQGGTDVELTTVTLLDEDGLPYEIDLAVAGTYENGLQLLDVTDPTDPTLLSTYDCDVYQGDVQLMFRDDMPTEDGRPRVFMVYGVDYSAELDSDCFTDLPSDFEDEASNGALIIEITDPFAPVSRGYVPTPGATHNGTVRGFDLEGDDGELDTWLLYNSENGGASGQLTVWDITDFSTFDALEQLDNITLQEAGTNTHDVTFSEDGTRAYVASIDLSYILDTTDPTAPTLVSRIIDPAATVHHQADPITIATPAGDRTYLLISDEINGAGGNGFCPGGGIHIWDITVEAAPVKVGAYYMPDITVQEGATTGTAGLISCTSHVFDVYPAQQLMTIGNMAGGVRVIDLSSLIGLSIGDENLSTGAATGMRDLGWFRFTENGITGSDSWTFKAHHGRFAEDGSFYGFSNDQTRGFEVFHFDATAGAEAAEGAQAESGWWATPEQAVARTRSLAPALADSDLLYSCRFPQALREGL